MPQITLLPSGRRIGLGPQENVLKALRRLGVEIDSPCDGAGTCGKCRVRVVAGDAAETPHRDLSAEQAARGVRLACRLAPTTDLTVELEGDYTLDARVFEGERLASARVAPAARVRRERDGAWLDYEGEEPAPLATWQDGFTPKGLAIDIGTTTLVVALLDLESGRELATASTVNPQVRCGHDVLSRIQKGSTPEGLAALAEAVRGALNRLIHEACGVSGSNSREIVDAVLGANPTMLELAAGLDPSPLGRLPFEVSLESGRSYPAARFGLDVNPSARAYVPPVAHAFVGSDISAGLLASRFFEGDGPSLFLDLGTNGELALASGGRRLVTSAAAGPAFEGMGISRGMRAAVGAVEAVSVGREDVEIRVIGGGPARGLCGSGLLDLVACLIRLGVVDRSGRMTRPPGAAGMPPFAARRLLEIDGRPAFLVAPRVTFAQSDVRQVQLAKGAVRTAVDLLLSEAGVEPAALKTVTLAGAFGHHLRPESLEAIGLLPPGLARRISFAGNTSRSGAELLLLDAGLRRRLEAEMAGVRHLGIPQHRSFQELFVASLGFPAAADPGERRPEG